MVTLSIQNHSETVQKLFKSLFRNRWVFGVPCGLSGRSRCTARRGEMKRIPSGGGVEQSVEQA